MPGWTLNTATPFFQTAQVTVRFAGAIGGIRYDSEFCSTTANETAIATLGGTANFTCMYPRAAYVPTTTGLMFKSLTNAAGAFMVQSLGSCSWRGPVPAPCCVAGCYWSAASRLRFGSLRGSHGTLLCTAIDLCTIRSTIATQIATPPQRPTSRWCASPTLMPTSASSARAARTSLAPLPTR